MACGGGCCDSNNQAQQTIRAPTPSLNSTSETTASCEDGCCGPSVPDPIAGSQSCADANNNVEDLPTGCCGPIEDSDSEHTASEKDYSPCENTCCSTTTAKPVIAREPDSCCAPSQEAIAKTTDEKAKKDLGPQCATKTSTCCPPDRAIGPSQCCSSNGGQTDDPPECCSTAKKARCCSDSIRTQDCCSSDKKDTVVDAIETVSSDSDYVDVEKGTTGPQHILMSISGMTCTGCETKLRRTLGTLGYVSNLKTSLVLARAEFDLRSGAATVEDVIKHLQRTTEFKCEQISNQGSSLDFICSGDPTSLIKGAWPDGVLEVRQVEKTMIRVEFDAKVTGARDLLEKQWTQSLRLAPPRPDPGLDAGNRHVRHMGLMTLLSAILTIPVLIMAWAPLPEREIAYGSASLALATIVQVAIAGPFYPKAIKALVFSRVIEMDLLIVLSTTAAYIFSVVSFGYLVSGHPLSTGEFFETSTLLVTLIMVGRWVASLARQKAAESISVRSLQTPLAVLVEGDGTEREIDARLLQYGDIFKVAPDSRIPTDGTVISGSSEIDESMLTGESQPVEKHTGAAVIAGSINGTGALVVRLTRLPGDNTITTIASMVDEAKLSKPKIQDIADKVASYFVPVVVALTSITFVIWIAIGVAVRKQSGADATIEAITYAITVLIVSCPCAIGLAVPMVIVVASGIAARRGVIFKSANSIEVAYKTTDVVFDKTGTLTAGQLAVVDEEYFDDDRQVTKSLLLGLLTNIKHPVSTAVAAHLLDQGLSASSVQDTKALPGKGVEGVSGGKRLRAGNSRWLGLSVHPRVQSMLAQGLTVLCFTVDDALAIAFGLRDTLRSDAASTVGRLQERGLNIHILSGDDDGAVQTIATQLSIPNGKVRSRCSPADKQAYIQALLATPSPSPSTSKPRKPVVLFVGDGTNDAVALAQATIGVHMSSGTDIAQSAADIVLMRPDLSGVLTIIAISRKAMHRVAFNFGWSFVYNLFAVLLGAGAFVRARIPPEFAGLGELVSVLPVIFAAVLLRWSRI
ncbi:Nn.00g100270.m01.CDS01 [Neocucurbitaria sp. VM-36]